MPEAPDQPTAAAPASPGKVLAVLGAPNAYHAKIMEAAGGGRLCRHQHHRRQLHRPARYGRACPSTECVQFGGYIARAVILPCHSRWRYWPWRLHRAVRRLVHECIRAGIGRHPDRRPGHRSQAQHADERASKSFRASMRSPATARPSTRGTSSTRTSSSWRSATHATPRVVDWTSD